MNQEKVHILVVEDNPDDLYILKTLLASDCKTVCTIDDANSLEQAAALTGTRDYDAILLDLSLPDSHGLETVEKVKKIAPSTATLILSGLDSEETAMEAMKLGAQDYIVKGQLNGAEIERSIRYAIERKKNTDALLERTSQFKVLFDINSDYLFLLDTHWKILQINTAAKKRFAVSENELSAKPVHEMDFILSQETFRDITSSPENISKVHFEMDVRCDTGELMSAECRLNAVVDSNGMVRSYLMALHDISDIKKEREELKNGKEKAEAVSKKITAELEVARGIQQELYPQSIDEIDGLHIRAELKQARQIGGDYYDIFKINDHEMAFLVADVAGHDIAAAFIVGMAKISFQAHSAVFSSPKEIFKRVNADMCKVVAKDRYLSAFMAVVNSHTRTLRYCSAGHFPQYLYHYKNRSVEELRTKGMFIGSFEEDWYEEKQLQLEIGDKILLFTDGIFENTNENNEQFGRRRFRDVVQDNGWYSCVQLHDMVMREQNKFCGDKKAEDDRCLLTIEIDECSYENAVKDILDTAEMSLPPMVLNSDMAVHESISMVLGEMDNHHFSDAIIRYYKVLLSRIPKQFFNDAIAQSSALKLFADVTDSGFKIVYLITSETAFDIHLFSSLPFRSFISSFDTTFGLVDINESGTRLTISYSHESEPAQGQDKNVRFTEENGIQYITIPLAITSNITPFTVYSDLLQSGVVNANYDLIKDAFLNNIGQKCRIGERFRYFDKRKEGFYAFEHASLEARLKLKEDYPADMRLTREDISYILNRHQITFGIRYPIIRELCDDPKPGKSYLIACGKTAQDGEDAQLIERVEVPYLTERLLNRQGIYNDEICSRLPYVKKDIVLIQKKPRRKGKPGTSIYGRTIDPYNGVDVRFPAGDNVAVSSDGLKLLADTYGYLYRDSRGLHILKLMKMKGDFTQEEEIVRIDGNLVVEGNIHAGAQIEAESDISVSESIENASVRTLLGTISCVNGFINASKILAGSDLVAREVLDSTIDCHGDILIEEAMSKCQVAVAGNIALRSSRTGTIDCCKIICKGSITANQICGGFTGPTEISLVKNISHQVMVKLAEARAKRITLQHELTNIIDTLQTDVNDERVNEEEQERSSRIELLTRDFFRLQYRLEMITKLIEQLRHKEITESVFGTITVNKMIVPPVIIKFGKDVLEINEPYGPSKIVYKNDTILVQPLS